MSFFRDLKVLWHLAVRPVRGKTHQERLESFYSGQAGAYDDFRKRLLKGREEMYSALPVEPGQVWVDMGGGTGANLEWIAAKVPQFAKIYVVDLSTSLLEIARQRVQQRGWTNVEIVEADATTFVPPEDSADLVTFSYSLTMIPDWFAAAEQAHRILKPGGHIGVVDFYVSRKFPAEGRVRHSWFLRTFWPTWFATDNVFLSPDHLPFLASRFQTVSLHEERARVPYVPLSRVPYYRFVGKK